MSICGVYESNLYASTNETRKYGETQSKTKGEE